MGGRYLSIIMFLLYLSPCTLYAWGERGHNSIARIAARLLAEDKDPAVAAFGRILANKEHMLGHLANVPDIVWRRGGPSMDQFNSPSHFIDLEYILPNGELKPDQVFPLGFKDYKERLLTNCKGPNSSCAPGKDMSEKLMKAGHAPFRIEALVREISKPLILIKEGANNPKIEDRTRIEMLDQSILYAGILAHFVGDLSNPHHTTSDYDSWQVDQGGLHSYFETEMVDAQDLGLDLDVFLQVQSHRPADAIFAPTKGYDALGMAWLMAKDSHQQLGALNQLDRKFSLLKTSEKEKSEGGKKTKAQRRAPREVAKDYHDFIVQRLAVGADALSRFWKLAYLQSAKPNLSFYHSYVYPVEPAFIPLGYDVIGPSQK